MQFLAGDCEVAEMQRFKDRPPEVQKCIQCHQEIVVEPGAERGEWNSEDGMTESILSQDDDRADLDLIKRGLPNDAQGEGGGGAGTGAEIQAFSDGRKQQ